jgi:hypothetical protein
VASYLQQNVDLFTWNPKDMLGLDPELVCMSYIDLFFNCCFTIHIWDRVCS